MEPENLVDRLKTILQDFKTKNENLDNDSLCQLRAGAAALLDKCDSEISYRGNMIYWSDEGVIRILHRDYGFTKTGGAKVKRIRR